MRARQVAPPAAPNTGVPAAPVVPPPPTTTCNDYGPEVVPWPYDQSWATGSYAPVDSPLAYGAFHGELCVDTAYHQHGRSGGPHHRGSAEVFRSSEFQLTQLGFGGDFY